MGNIGQVKEILQIVWQDASKWGETFRDSKSVEIWLEDKAQQIAALYQSHSLPAQPELLTDEEIFYIPVTSKNDKPSYLNEIARIIRLIQEDTAKAQASLTASQKDAEIAELKSQLESCVNTLKERDNMLEKAEARIKELKGLTDSLQEKIETIRADQNRKIGEDLTKILLDDTIKNSISRCRTITDYVADNLIAKLQKGEDVE